MDDPKHKLENYSGCKMQITCRRCGSSDTIKNGGGRILCKSCGRQTSITPVERITPDFKKRPPCLYCGAYHALAYSPQHYKCGECGKLTPREQVHIVEAEPDLRIEAIHADREVVSISR
jgi:ribosomal protein S27AE